jgi:signal transduction histidine kinase/CheY-like chemotaxis protein
MAASTVYLQAFQEIVSIGQSTDTVATIAQRFCETLSHRLLLLDPQQRPIGVIYLPKLLSYLLSNQPQQMPIINVQPSLIEPLPSGQDQSMTMGAAIETRCERSPSLESQVSMTEELAARNADLTQLNQLKDEFLACVTHELRSPLTAVLGLSTLLKDQSLGPLNDRQLRYAKLIYNSGRHLISIVNDMLDLTRIETNQLELNLTTVDISQVCLNAFNQARQLRHLEDNHFTSHAPATDNAASPSHQTIELEATNLPSFNLEIAPDLISLTADENRLRQMLVNLLSNALKFTDNQGNIGLRVNRWEGWIAFTVWDTGIGIPPDKQHLIFQKFQQLESTMTRQFEGTGLGLALTMRLARLHGGDISFTSQENQGSQFTLLLPPEPPPSISPKSLPRQSPIASVRPPVINGAVPTASRLALVIEASPPHLEDLSTHLTELGYRIAVARSGPDALTKARQLQPTVIFINPTLPILSGWDVLTLLKAGELTQHIPVIVTAAQADRAKAAKFQADGCLSSPILHPLLVDALAKLSTPEPITPIHTHKPHVIVYLSPAEGDTSRTLKINHLLHQYNFRVLESHNLEQAEMLAKVWKAQVVVLNQNPLSPSTYLSQFVTYPYLASLPLITLDEATTQAANQMPDLAVFPCLVEWDHPRHSERRIRIAPEAFTENLLQAVEVAIGFAGRPLILATDIDQWQVSPSSDGRVTGGHRHWLNALAQYVQAAGLRCTIGRSPTDILHTLETQSVDLLLLHWNQNQGSLPPIIKTLKMLQADQQTLPATILINSEAHPNEISPSLRTKLDDLHVTIVNSSESMDDLLSQIRQLLGIAN